MFVMSYFVFLFVISVYNLLHFENSNIGQGLARPRHWPLPIRPRPLLIVLKARTNIRGNARPWLLGDGVWGAQLPACAFRSETSPDPNMEYGLRRSPHLTM